MIADLKYYESLWTIEFAGKLEEQIKQINDHDSTITL